MAYNCMEAVMSLRISSVLEAIQNSNFDWKEDWQRRWNAQPIASRPYYVGKPNELSVFGYNLQWMPRTRQLSIWPVDGGKGKDIK